MPSELLSDPRRPRLRERRTGPRRAWAASVVVVALVAACSKPGSFESLMDISVCDPAAGGFTAEIDNPYFPLPVGQQVVLEGGGVLVRIASLDEVRTVAGVQTRVVEEYEEIDGRLVELSRNFFAQAEDGTVCYFGEEVDMYDNGEITSHAGAWTADGDWNLPGIFMPASPQVGQAFQQEIAPGIAEDQSRIDALGERTVVPGGTFEDTVTMLDRDPLSGGEDTKVYARGVGLIVDEAAQMTSFVVGP
jgi:hypothetical protein